jgi:hypothetical protein
MKQTDVAERYLARLRALVEEVEASEYPLHPDDVLSVEEMAVLALRFASLVTLLDAMLTLGYAPLPRDWRAAV